MTAKHTHDSKVVGTLTKVGQHLGTVPAHTSPMVRYIASKGIERLVLSELFSNGQVVSAIYEPQGNAPLWAAALVGQRCTWSLHPTMERGLDPRQWAMSPDPLGMAIEGSARWGPLEHLQAIEFVDSASGE